PRNAAQRVALIELAASAALPHFADHHAHAVVDEHAPADCRARMDLDAGEEADRVRREAREPAQAHRPERVRHAMELQRVEARITREDFPHAASGGIAFENALDVFTHAAEHVTGSSLDHDMYAA